MNRKTAGVLALLLLLADGAGPEQVRPVQDARMSDGDTTRIPSVTRKPSAACSPFAARSASAARSAPGLIGLSYEWLDGETPDAVGQPLRIRVSVFSAHPVESPGAEVYAHEGLVVSPARWAIGELQARQSGEQVLTVTPYAAGSLRFSILVQGRVEGQRQAAQITVTVPGFGLQDP